MNRKHIMMLIFTLLIFSATVNAEENYVMRYNRMKVFENFTEKQQSNYNKLISTIESLKLDLKEINRKLIEKDNSLLIEKRLYSIQKKMENIETGIFMLNEKSIKIESISFKTNKSIAELKIINLLVLLVIATLIIILIYIQVKFMNRITEENKKEIELFNQNWNSIISIIDYIEKLNSNKNDEDKQNHDLVIKVADEITRIEKNISRMDDVKGLKQLKASVSRIKDNLYANGYEIVDLLGKEYNEGMKTIANFIIDENMKSEKSIITRIIKPQINYKGIMIQSSQIEVSSK